jgi:hypothetical protein
MILDKASVRPQAFACFVLEMKTLACHVVGFLWFDTWTRRRVKLDVVGRRWARQQYRKHPPLAGITDNLPFSLREK